MIQPPWITYAGAYDTLHRTRDPINVAKVGKLLASGGKLKNLVYLSFDAAHQIRIASKDPLQALPDFENNGAVFSVAGMRCFQPYTTAKCGKQSCWHASE